MTRPPALGGPERIRLLEIAGNAIVGGMETSVLRLIERLPVHRFQVTVLCPYEGRFADRLRTLGAEVVIVAMPMDEVSWNALQATCALVRSLDIDLIHAHLPNAHLLAGMASCATGVPVLATIHGRQVTLLDFEVQRLAATHLHLVCRHTFLHGLALGVPGSHLHAIPNGVDLEHFAPRPRGAGALRARLGVPRDAQLVGFVGRLSPEKGPDVFVRMAAVLQRVVAAHFVLMGDGPMRSELEDQARAAGLQDRVHFAAAQDDVAPLYAELAVLVQCSYSEAMPLVLMEAMACGVPVIATHVGGVPEIVRQGETGYLVHPGDYQYAAMRVAELLQDPPQRATLGGAARRHAEQSLSLAPGIEALTDLFQELIGDDGERLSQTVEATPPAAAARS